MTRRANTKAIRNARELLARHGRNGDTLIAHISREEARLLDAWQGGTSLNPVTGLPEYFKWKKVLKGVARAAGAAAGAYFGGPAGAAVGGALATKLTGGSWKTALGNGLISGIGAYGIQQTGLGDGLGISSLGSGADLLGRTGTAAATSGGGAGLGSMAKFLPIAGIGAAALMAKKPKGLAAAANAAPAPDVPAIHYEPLDREYRPYGGDYAHYGEEDGQHQYYDEVNPRPVQMAGGGAAGRGSGGGHSASRDRSGPGGTSRAGPDRGDRGGGGNNNPFSGIGSGFGNVPGSQGPAAPGQAPQRDLSGQIAGRKELARLDEANVGETWSDGLPGILNELGHIAIGPFGLDEDGEMTTQQALRDLAREKVAGAPPANEAAHYNFDPVQGLATLAGLTTGFPAGSLYGAGKYGYESLTGNKVPWSKDLGTSVFGGTSGGWGGPTGREAGFGGLGGGDSQGGIHDDRGGQGQAVLQGLSQAFGGTQNAITPGAPAPITPPVTTAPVPETPRGRNYIPLSEYASYGEGPMHLFYDNVNPVTAATGGGIHGPGHGQEDKIPAMLSSGEFVVDSATVSAIGGGSTDAGVAKLEALRKAIRKKAGYKNTTKIPPAPMGIGSMLQKVA